MLGGDTLLLGTLDLLDGLLWRWELLRHGPAQIGNRVTHILANREVCRIGVELIVDGLTPDFGLGLCDTESVGGELFTTHVIENALILCEALSRADVASLLAVIQPHVAEVLEDSEVACRDDASAGDRSREIAILLGDLPSKEQAFLVLRKLVGLFIQAFRAATV